MDGICSKRYSLGKVSDFNEIRVPKTHDLDQLLEVCEKNEPIRNLRNITFPFNDYSVITRYPFYQRIDIADKEQAIQAAEEVLDTIKSELR